jgi:hypothetical protein
LLFVGLPVVVPPRILLAVLSDLDVDRGSAET